MSKITKSAKGEDCTVRLPAICNGNPETTVFAHINGGGMGRKYSDLHCAYACSDCHAWLDGGYANDPNANRDKRDYEHLYAMFRTQIKLLEKGLVKI